MKKEELVSVIRSKHSFLCVGLDSDIDKIPRHLLKFADPVFEFNKQIIEATQEYCVAYKINTAFYESRGAKGWESLEKTVNAIPEGVFTIADAKRGDIGNTARHYARTFFETMSFDAITLSPYMGKDTIRPFLEYDNKWAILLGLTSNPGAMDFEMLQTDRGTKVYEEVIKKCALWGTPDNMMFVTGATRPELLEEIRKIIPDHFLLVPGVGAQGGSLELTYKFGANNEIGMLVNSSRDIIFSDNSEGFAEAAGKKAAEIQRQMTGLIGEKA